VSELAVMDRDKGDAKYFWDRHNRDEVEVARRAFAGMKAKGYLAYKLDASGNKGEVIREFDPDAEQIIMSPQSVGG
jgi:hypothetical protein